MKKEQSFEEHIMFCYSTGNQTVNLIPAIQFKLSKAIIFSTYYTEKARLTERLEKVMKNRNINTTIHKIDSNEEKNPPVLIDKLVSLARGYDKIIWNFTGGQKIPTIAFHNAFKRRTEGGFTDDILLYLEAKPPETWFYDSSFTPRLIKTNADINLQEILYIYGYELYKNESEKDIEIYPSPSKDTKEKLNIGRKALNYYLEDDYFREAFFNWMKPDEPEIKNKSDIQELIRVSLNELKPHINDIKITKYGYEDLEKKISIIIKNLKNDDIPKLKKDIGKLKLINKPEEIFNDYWHGIKREIIDKTLGKIQFNKVRLLQRDVDTKISENIRKEIEDIGGVFSNETGDVLYKKDIQHFSALKKGNGFLFEWMVSAQIYDLVAKDPSLKESINQIHLGVKTKPVNSLKHDSELDLVITTKFGTLIILELKTHDFSGETAKAKEGTTLKKSGPYGKAIVVGPLLKSIVTLKDNNTKDYPHYIDGIIRSQQETAERNGISYWYLDDISEELGKIIK